MKSGTSILTGQPSSLVIFFTMIKDQESTIGVCFMCSCKLMLGGNFVNVGCQLVYDVVAQYGTILM